MRRRHRCAADLRDQHQFAAVEGIRGYAAHEREHDDGHDADEPDEAERETFVIGNQQ